MAKVVKNDKTISEKKCFICGKRTKLTKTECCNQWICNDEDKYVLFSYAQNSCHRNHRRYTLCGFHYNEGHAGDWKTCKKCKDEIEPEMYAYYGTNEYNYEKLEKPPKYKPTHCSKCRKVINLSEGGFAINKDGYVCMNCFKL